MAAAAKKALEDREWFPLKESVMWKSYSKVVLGLLLPQRVESSDRVGAINILTTLINAQLVESGFVPIVNGMPSMTADAIMEMPMVSRMVLLTQDLLRILEIQNTLRRVTYRCIVANENEVPETVAHPQSAVLTDASNNSNSKYKYNDLNLEFALLKETDGLLVIMSSRKLNKSFKLTFGTVFKLSQYKLMALTSSNLSPTEFLLDRQFQVEGFVHSLKRSFIFPILDHYDAMSEDCRGLMGLPDEILVEMAKYMDIKSFLNFTMVNKRANEVLRPNEEVWKVQFCKLGRVGVGKSCNSCYRCRIASRFILSARKCSPKTVKDSE